MDFRFRLVRGKFQVGVKEFQNAGRMMDYTRDLALCVNSVDVEANFAKRPSGNRSGRRDPTVRTIGQAQQFRHLEPKVRPKGGEGLLRHGPEGGGGGAKSVQGGRAHLQDPEGLQRGGVRNRAGTAGWCPPVGASPRSTTPWGSSY